MHLLPKSCCTTNPVTHFSQILDLCKKSLLFDAIQLTNTLPTSQLTNKPLLYASLLQTSAKVLSFNPGLQIHSHVIKSGLEIDRFVGNSLLSLYFKLSPVFLDTRKVFDGLFVKDVVSWSAMISGCVRVGKCRDGLVLFQEMVDAGIEPNGFTLSSVIKACAELGEVRLGQGFHGVVVKCGFGSSCVVCSSLIDMYGRNFFASDAHKVFDEVSEPDSVCWTSVISALTRSDFFEEALGVFYLMQRDRELRPDGYTFGSVLTACGNLGRSKQGRQIHSKVICAGLCGNVVVESSLVDMYGKCGLVDEAQCLFDRMPNKNSVSWCALLGGYCQSRKFEMVIQLFQEMQEVDLYCFGTVLRACAGMAALRQGKEVHCQYVRRGGWQDVITESALVDLYAKCGGLDNAYRIFSQMTVRNLITWNSMICGFAQNGRGREALGIFSDMIEAGVKPDNISFVGVLFACSHTGLVDQGKKHFVSMTEEYGIKPEIEHYNCMVDLLGRAGLLEEAENLIENADCRDDPSLWEVLLGACTTSDSIIAERIAKKVMELEPENHLSYVHLSNLYRAVGRWNEALEIRGLMHKRLVKKMPGRSWI